MFTEVVSDSYEIRDSPRRAIGSVLSLYGAAVAPALIAFLIGMAGEDFWVVPWAGVGLTLAGLLTALLAVGLVAVGTHRLIKAVRRAVIVAVDRGGIRFDRTAIGWPQVRRISFYTLESHPGSRDDPPAVYIDYLQVDRQGGGSDRCSSVEGRDPWGELAAAIRRVAPHVEIDYLGTLPDSEDPMRRRR